MWGLTKSKIELDRKVLSNIAILFPEVFDEVVKSVE